MSNSETSKGFKKGFDSKIFIKAVKMAAGVNNYVPVSIFDALVIDGSQDENKMTCFVNSKDSTLNNLEVRYHLCIEDGEVNIPADGSVVTIAMTAFTDPYIVKFTDLSSKTISIGNQVYSNDGEIQDFEFYQDSGSGIEGSFGGFVKLVDPSSSSSGILFRIQQIESRLNTFLQKWDAFCSVYVPSSPSITGLPATLSTSSVPQISPTTTRSDLENTKIIHGVKNKPTN